MLPIFTSPLALSGLLALPALAVIYLLRNRYRRQVVSSLLLWRDPHQPREGGPRLDRLQTLLLFLLELLLLALLALAAASPFLPAPQAGRPLVVVLDDSYSMLAGEPDSPRSAALTALAEELRRSSRPAIRFILAGEQPVLLGPSVRSTPEAIRQLERWRCQSPGAALDAGLALAAEVGGEAAALLVLTDRPPTRPIDRGRVLWRAFGHRRGNVAIVSAARSGRDGAERCVIVVESLYDAERSTTLVVETGQPPVAVARRELTLKPGVPDAVIVPLRAGTGVLHAHVSDDALAIDNRVTLLPAPEKLVAVQLSLEDAVLRRQTEKGLLATRAARTVTQSPALLITDAALPPLAQGETWIVHLTGGKENTAYDGPFLLERTHPLMEGLSLKGVVWAPGVDEPLPGSPLILAGNTALVTDSEDSFGRHLIRIRLRHELSTLLESPSWPVFLSNLLSWRASRFSGLIRSNVRLGEEVPLILGEAGEIELRRPDGTSESLSVQQGRVVARAGQPGIHELVRGEEKWTFAVNALNREESDLRGCVSRTFGDWLDEAGLRYDYLAIGWALLLVVLAVTALHLLLVRRLGGRNR